MKRALVLGGGGAKGSYQIGVWKAIRKLHMKFDIVTGVSIGSINGGFYAAKKYHLAKRMWENVKTTDFFEYDIGGKKLDSKEYIGIFKKIFSGGMSFANAENYLKKYLKEEDIRNSNIDYGLLTVSLTTKKPRSLTKEVIPKGKLLDYICASSSCYPFVEKKEIDEESFIDGGFYDDLPINLAIEMGAEEILAVDLSVLGMKQNIRDKNIKINTIKMKDSTLLTLSFNRKYAKRNIALGYNDAMKYFGKLDGEIYTFKKNNLLKNYNNVKKQIISLLNNILFDKEQNAEVFNLSIFSKLFYKIKNKKDINKEINEAIEYLGKIFEITNTKIYNINQFNKILVTKVNELNYIKINKNLKGKFLVSYIYNKYTQDNKNLNKELFNIALFFPKDFIAAIYLIAMTNKYKILLDIDQIYDEIIDKR